MSDIHPPYGGQPDPNAGGCGICLGPPAGPFPPGSPVGQPLPPGSPVAQSGYPPPYGAPPPPPPPPPYGVPPQQQKSNKGLGFGLGIGAGVMAILSSVAAPSATSPSVMTTTTQPIASASTSATTGSGGAPSATPPAGAGEPDNNNAVTAPSSSDMSAVCDGSPILNAAPYTSPKGAKIFTFANSPERVSTWRYQSAGYDKPYYARSTDWSTVAVVGCMTLVNGSEGAGKKCDYKASDGKQVTVDYVSSRYALSFHNAQTAEKIADGGTINAPAVSCPSFVSYNKATLKAYASPDDGALELALDKFTS